MTWGTYGHYPFGHFSEQLRDPHMEVNYHQYEFDLRVYLTLLDAGGPRLWTERT